MATTLHVLRNDASTNVHTNLYPRTLMTDFDLKDNRYPSLSPKPRGILGHNPSSLSADMASLERRSLSGGQSSAKSYDLNDNATARSVERPPSQDREGPASRKGAQSPEAASTKSQTQQSQDLSRMSLSNGRPDNVPPRVLERYSLDDNGAFSSSQQGSTEVELRQNGVTDSSNTPTRSNTPQPTRQLATVDVSATLTGNTPRHPDIAAASSPSTGSNGNQFPPIMPLSASPNYIPPVASRNRTYPQQPTYINPSNPPNGVNAVYTPLPPPQEEVCVECAMRDQDMADVDVTSPGIWERASDVLFEELKQREADEEAQGFKPDPHRARSVGGMLTEQNLKIWLSINPREPASRQQTLNTYVKAQRALLEAEAKAHSRAMQEAKRLDTKMRDAYSQLRRSAYDLGSAPVIDDNGGVRIKPPKSPISPNHSRSHTRSQSREITLLENGMIVEHVDVRREEKEERERRRKEEKRARKSSRSSVLDATSIISAHSSGPLTDSGLKPYSRYSHTTSGRPNSVLSSGQDRPEIPRAYSQASFSDIHSLNSGSGGKRRFFGVRNLSTGWRSQESLAPSFAPSGVSGSMVDMHVALQREDRRRTLVSPMGTSRKSMLWQSSEIQDNPTAAAEEKAKKKKNGLIKWWRTVTGTHKPETFTSRESFLEKQHDDGLPLAPPPPLSYLVERNSPEMSLNNRHASTLSIPPPSAQPFAQPLSISPPPSGLSTSPTSMRQPNGDASDSTIVGFEESGKSKPTEWRLHPVSSEPNLRQSAINQEPIPPVPSLPNGPNARLSLAISREKSLPPIPCDESPALLTPVERPRTVYTYETPRALPPGTRPPHDFLPPPAPFQSLDSRRQSFGGMTSRPNITVQTAPHNQTTFDPRISLGPQYDEFGNSRRSLGRFDFEHEGRRGTSPLPTPSKRKSKFGFASLLGKKSKEPENLSDHGAHPFPSMGGRNDDSGQASFENQRTNRMSVLSRKPLNELVAQDPEFKAYRYPSTEQRLDLLR
ncbi:hypothetical protein FA15DRAFT_658694 [Coprinopsis marcescibilis]|uniref:Uncharacterized protein n=1 Tax=Coprinopsis marcescibilis TaxID=230819 RepID=A0A5C3KL62_COPMA|nr:hypothetical protein FA15DRAFT_658694 [Coprinopsis marcescibilis]